MISEGLALLAHEMIFAPGEAEAWLAEHIYPDAGMRSDHSDLTKIHRAKDILFGVSCPRDAQRDQLWPISGTKTGRSSVYFCVGMLAQRDETSERSRSRCGPEKRLMLLKEVTDQGKLQYDHLLGVCLVAVGCGNTITLKEILDQPEPTWLQWRRRLDPLQPFCRIASHTAEEVRDILATLEQVYQPFLPRLNLRQWTSSIYAWLTQPTLDPTRSGRVTMDNLMKLVVAALEWSYEAKATDVQVEWLEQAAELLVLRHDTFRIIDGEGPGIEADQARGAEPVQMSETQTEQVSSPNEEQKLSSSVPTEQAPLARSRKKAGEQPATSDKCTFSGDVHISLKRFEESGVARVECPGCGRTWTLSPSGGVLHFKSHDKRKMNTPNTGRR